MKKHSIRIVEWPRWIWQSLVRKPRRSHDWFLVYNMASFNYGGGWSQLLLKASLPTT
jgi:hypothetical protein